MGKKLAVAFLIAVSLMFVATAAFAAGDMGKCAQCGMNMDENQNTAYEITFTDGKVSMYCCPHCGLWVQAGQKDKIKSARARDFISGEWTDPAKMYYVVGSSATPACAPSWIAFAKKDEAHKFVKGFGGKVLDFKDALKRRAKEPESMKMGK